MRIRCWSTKHRNLKHILFSACEKRKHQTPALLDLKAAFGPDYSTKKAAAPGSDRFNQDSRFSFPSIVHLPDQRLKHALGGGAVTACGPLSELHSL